MGDAFAMDTAPAVLAYVLLCCHLRPPAEASFAVPYRTMADIVGINDRVGTPSYGFL